MNDGSSALIDLVECGLRQLATVLRGRQISLLGRKGRAHLAVWCWSQTGVLGWVV